MTTVNCDSSLTRHCVLECGTMRVYGCLIASLWVSVSSRSLGSLCELISIFCASRMSVCRSLGESVGFVCMDFCGSLCGS